MQEATVLKKSRGGYQFDSDARAFNFPGCTLAPKEARAGRGKRRREEKERRRRREAHTLPFGDCHCRESYGRGMSGWGGQTSHNLPSLARSSFFSRMSINTGSKAAGWDGREERARTPSPPARARGKELSDKCAATCLDKEISRMREERRRDAV